jgi:2-iminobutanoate/2-iminopropanoate deaminase
MSEKTVVRTESAPAPFQGAPYSQAIVANGFVFVAGQVGLQPDHTELVGDGIVEQTEQAFDNLAAILEEAGSGLDRIVKTTVFLDDFDDFAAMNEVYARRIGDRPPARSTVEVAALPSGAKVEIEAIALA